MPKCDFNKVALHSFATLLKSHFGMGVLLQICCIFSEDLFLRTPLGGCFCNCKVITNYCAKYVEIRHFSDPYFSDPNTCFEIRPFALLLTICTIKVTIGTNFN